MYAVRRKCDARREMVTPVVDTSNNIKFPTRNWGHRRQLHRSRHSYVTCIDKFSQNLVSTRQNLSLSFSCRILKWDFQRVVFDRRYYTYLYFKECDSVQLLTTPVLCSLHGGLLVSGFLVKDHWWDTRLKNHIIKGSRIDWVDQKQDIFGNLEVFWICEKLGGISIFSIICRIPGASGTERKAPR